MGIIKHYNLKQTDIFIFDHYVINQIHDGAIIKPPDEKELNKIIQKHFSGKDMVYISNRMNSYTVDPLIYPKVEDIPNLVAIALVPKTKTMRNNAEYEKNFYDKPFKVFYTLMAAVLWTDKVLRTEEKK
ncbi:hypothetical protein AAFN75_16650 [Algibacter sp. AS12]|uniref:hypothetical protein n=1 Tax=Algibacter sp. AS12 TaxID=3135773 RepID=UPI00398AD743